METNFYPLTQRRLRTDNHIRELVSSVHVSHRQFIQPIFVEEGIAVARPVAGLNDMEVDTIDSMIARVAEDLSNGISKFLLFPIPATKVRADSKEARFDFSFAANVVRRLRDSFGDALWLASDLCLCSYTEHGHCGILSDDHTSLLNNKTVEVLAQYASLLANAGVNCIAPSDMMDGRTAAIRTRLDALGHEEVGIMSYAAKFSSQFYGPFRDACKSSPRSHGLKNRKSYQLSPSNPNDAMATALRDEREGADILMVKPAALYTDIIARLRQQTLRPIAAYHVSGEYAAIETLAAAGLADREAAHVEVWTALKRSGADIIISYAARNAKNWIENSNL